MLALGIEPVRKLRDYYRDCISPGRIAAKKRGRKRVPKLVGRNHDIYEEFTRMPGGKGVKYVSLGKKHDREPDTIRKIVGQVGKSIRKSGNK